MKFQFKLASLLCFLSVLLFGTGCSIFKQPVPTTSIRGTIAGQTFRLDNPKDTVLTNLVVEVNTNGVAKLSLGYLSSANNSNVIGAATTGQAETINALGTQILNGINAGAMIAGKVAAGAVK